LKGRFMVILDFPGRRCAGVLVEYVWVEKRIDRCRMPENGLRRDGLTAYNELCSCSTTPRLGVDIGADLTQRFSMEFFSVRFLRGIPRFGRRGRILSSQRSSKRLPSSPREKVTQGAGRGCALAAGDKCHSARDPTFVNASTFTPSPLPREEGQKKGRSGRVSIKRGLMTHVDVDLRCTCTPAISRHSGRNLLLQRNSDCA